jgi:hypothetical protein
VLMTDSQQHEPAKEVAKVCAPVTVLPTVLPN